MDVGKSLAADRRSKSKTVSKPGYGDQGDAAKPGYGEDGEEVGKEGRKDNRDQEIAFTVYRRSEIFRRPL